MNVQLLQELFKADFFNIREVLKDIYEWPDGLLEIDYPMWVLSNQKRVYGAGVLLYENQLEQIAEKMQGDFIVLPSSVREVLITPIIEKDMSYLLNMVREINKEQHILEERLADNIYIYHREIKSLGMVS